MIALTFQLALVAFAAGYLVRRRAELRRRNAQTWEGLVSELRLDWNPESVQASVRMRNRYGNGKPEDVWNDFQGSRGLCVMAQNAHVMMCMADYASRHSFTADHALLSQLRNDAMQIRIRVAVLLVQYAFTRASTRLGESALRTVTLYTGMIERMTELMQSAVGGAQPALAGAL